MKIKNIVFDLDGTLLYTLQDLCDSVNYVLKKNNEPERTLSEIRSFVGNGVHKLMERSVPAGISPEDLERQYEDFKTCYAAHDRDTTRPFDGIPELLAELHRRGIGIAVVTNKFQGAAEPLMEDYFGSLINVTVGAAEGIPHKPQPLMVYKAMNMLSGKGQGIGAPSAAAKAETLYVGDSTVDAATAENAGLSYILCDWGYNDREALEKQQALAIVSRPEQILDYVD